MHDDKTSEGLSPVTLEAMQQHRTPEETRFHPVLEEDYVRAEDSASEFVSFLGGLVLLLLFVLYAFSGNL